VVPVNASITRPSATAVATAAYGVALRITGDEELAVASVERITASGISPSSPGTFVCAVRAEARAHRSPVPIARETAARPPQLSQIAIGDWAVVERVTLRGLSITETADALGIGRAEAIRALDRGLRDARSSLLAPAVGSGEARDETHAARRDRLDTERPARSLDDATRDRQPETAARRSAAA
jgi:hypothetical protein